MKISHCLVLWLLLGLGSVIGATPERKTIVILGDSLAAGSGIDPDEAFPALLQERIDQRKLPFEVVNAGN